MPVIWGCLDRIEHDLHGTQWIQVKVTLPGGSMIRTRALVGRQTLVARGIERVDLSTLCSGELVEVSYHHGRDGFMEAETIYVQADRAAVGKSDEARPCE